MPVDSIKQRLPSIPSCSGIYQFFDDKENVLYVGKAKNLRKRVASYTNQNRLSSRILRMINLAVKVEIVRTASEAEALLLEHNLIKKFSPQFNILLKDDKAFAQIQISNHKSPRISKYRGAKKNDGFYFGPFANTTSVNQTIDVIRKSFGLRNCTDMEFKSRTKPCLEFQIKKCLAPCVEMVSPQEYQAAVKEAISVLSGKSAIVQEKFQLKMHEFSKNFEFEKAAIYRDKIKALQSIALKQNINLEHSSNFDIIAAVALDQKACIYVSFYRSGQNYGARPYFFDLDENQKIADLIADFLGQFYLNCAVPPILLLSHDLEEAQIMNQFLTMTANQEQFSNNDFVSAKSNEIESQKILSSNSPSEGEIRANATIDKKFSVKILVPKKGEKLALIQSQQQIALQILEQKLSNNLGNRQLLIELKKIFNLPKIPARIEVYDNSHTFGENAVGAMISAGVDGFIKSGYRKFNIRTESIQNLQIFERQLLGNKNTIKNNLHEVLNGKAVEGREEKFFENSKEKSESRTNFESTIPKADTSMLHQVLLRRFSPSKVSTKKLSLPDLVLIDGGKPQLSTAIQVFAELELKIPIICMSKGEKRNAGEEWFHMPNHDSFTLPKNSPVMYYLQRLRDEAHRFAITTHRKRREKAAFY